MGTVTFVDETTSGERRRSLVFEVAEERLTAGELIRRRVFQEVAEYNARQLGEFNGLVQPTDAERTLNGYRLRPRHRIDPEQSCAAALAAFRSNGFLLLVGDRQVEHADEVVELPPGAEVAFLKLVPLVGG